MAYDKHANLAYSTVLTAPSPASSGTSLVVQSGDGTRFPAVPFNATVWPAGARPTPANAEIVRVTTVSTDTFTITRTQESTSARTIVVGDQIANTATVKAFTDIETDLASALTQTALQAAQIAARSAADLGYFVPSGLALTANATALTSVTTTIATSLLNKTAHGLVAGDTITMTGISTTTGIANGTVYFVSATGLTANAFRVAATSGGTAITFGGTTDSSITVTEVGKLDLAAGVAFIGTTELNVAAVTTGAANNIAALADATNPKWVAIELDTSGVVNFNQGTAAVSPAFPTPTGSRVVLGWLWVPAAATQVDTLLTTNNGNAKLIDARIVRSNHYARVLATDTTLTQLTNPTALTTLLAAAPSIPANSLNIGDVLVIEASGNYKNTQNNSTIEIQLSIGGVGVADYTTVTLNLDGTNGRRWTLRAALTVVAIGGSGSLEGATQVAVSPPSSGTNAPVSMSLGGGAGGDLAIGSDLNLANVNTTTGLTVDLKAKITTSSSTAIINVREFSIIKTPA